MKEEGDDNDSATQSNDQEAETDAFSTAGLFFFGTTDGDLFERQKARNRSAKIDTDHDDDGDMKEDVNAKLHSIRRNSN